MSGAPKSEALVIDGPAGDIEALLESPADRQAVGGAVLCHPHPQHGGTMHNKVVHMLARAFVTSGFEALRFNFRGVGKSAGQFDAGRGELEDAIAAVRWLRHRGGSRPTWLGGFSFGAAIAIRAAVECDVDGLVSIAPAVSRVTQFSGPQPACPWLIVQGGQDELVDANDTVAWVNDLEPGPELLLFDDAEHYFHGKLVKLRGAVEDFIGERSRSS